MVFRCFKISLVACYGILKCCLSLDSKYFQFDQHGNKMIYCIKVGMNRSYEETLGSLLNNVQFEKLLLTHFEKKCFNSLSSILSFDNIATASSE